MWSGVTLMFRVNWNPRLLAAEMVCYLTNTQPKGERMLWTFFALQSWAFWTTCNKFTIKKKFPQQPANCIFKYLLNLQLWRPL
jgi:hypothetical protein